MLSDIWPGIVGMVRRVRLKDFDGTGSQHTATVTGLKGEELKVVRQKEFGFNSNPPKGSHALMVTMGQSSDRGMIFGIDSPDWGARDLPEGGTEFYDANGNTVRMTDVGLEVTAASKMVLKQGDATITVEGGAIAIVSTTLTHNGKNIGSTHVHTGVQAGPVNTGVPA